MNAAETVMHVVNRNCGNVVLDFLRERVRQTRKPAHRHTHDGVRALDKTGRDFGWIGTADFGFLSQPLQTAGFRVPP